jgi:hypothetical protein
MRDATVGSIVSSANIFLQKTEPELTRII